MKVMDWFIKNVVGCIKIYRQVIYKQKMSENLIGKKQCWSKVVLPHHLNNPLTYF